MGYQIIIQPNDKLALWSSIVDDFVVMDFTKQELVDYLCDQKREEIQTYVSQVLDRLEQGEEPYLNRTMTYDEAVIRIKEVHGQEYASQFAQETTNG